MRTLLLILLFVFLPFSAQADTIHLVKLKDGSEIRAISTRHETGTLIEVKRLDGSFLTVQLSDIDTISVIDEAPRVNRSFPTALSGLFPLVSPLHGLGQFYNNEPRKGIFFLALGVVGSSVAYSGYRNERDRDGSGRNQLTIGGVILLSSWVLSTIDAHDSAR